MLFLGNENFYFLEAVDMLENKERRTAGLHVARTRSSPLAPQVPAPGVTGRHIKGRAKVFNSSLK